MAARDRVPAQPVPPIASSSDASRDAPVDDARDDARRGSEPRGSRLVATVRDEWPRLVLELVVLVVGISASFALEEWRGERENARIERRAWEAVQVELAADTVAIRRQMTRLERMIRASGELLTGPPADSVDAYLDLAISYTGFTPTANAWAELRASSAGRQLQRRALFDTLAALHLREYERAGQWDAINRQIVLDRVLPYLTVNAPASYAEAMRGGLETQGFGPTWAAMRRDRVFRNLLATQRSFREAQFQVYDLALGRARATLAAVARALASSGEPAPDA